MEFSKHVEQSLALTWKNVSFQCVSSSASPVITVSSPPCRPAFCHTVNTLMFSLPLPLPDRRLSLLHLPSVFFPPPIPTACLYFTRPCGSILPGNKMWQESVQFERTRNWHCESFLLFLNTCFLFSLSARETLFQQMSKTDITINLFFEKEERTSNVIHHICFIVQCVCVRCQRRLTGFVC